MVRLVDETNEAIDFFNNEITQYKTILNGYVNKDYRTYIENKIKYYKLAIESLEEEIKE